MTKQKDDLKSCILVTWLTMTAFIIVAFLLRLSNTYEVDAHLYDVTLRPLVGNIVCWVLYAIETFIIFRFLTKLKNWQLLLISIGWTILVNIIWNTTVVGILEMIVILIIPAVINKHIKYVLYSILLFLFMYLVQRIFVYSLLGSSDATLKYDYISNIAMMLYLRTYFIFTYINLRGTRLYEKFTR